MTALLVIDMQAGLFRAETPRFDTEGVVARINALGRAVWGCRPGTNRRTAGPLGRGTTRASPRSQREGGPPLDPVHARICAGAEDGPASLRRPYISHDYGSSLQTVTGDARNYGS